MKRANKFDKSSFPTSQEVKQTKKELRSLRRFNRGRSKEKIDAFLNE